MMNVAHWQEAGASVPVELARFSENVRRWEEAGVVLAADCYAAMLGGAIIGGAALTAPDDGDRPLLDFVMLPGAINEGPTFLQAIATLYPDERFSYHLYNDSDDYAAYTRCFEAAGFEIVQTKWSYRFVAGTALSEDTNVALIYRPITETGEAEFARAVGLVMDGSLDRDDQASVRDGGIETAGWQHLRTLMEIEGATDRWVLAYKDGALAGLVVPSVLGEGYGGINYIGVLPGMRGQGIIHALVRKATRALLDAGVQTVIADVDVENAPMQRALLSAGYRKDCEMVALKQGATK